MRTTRLKGFLYHCPNFIPLPFDGTTITSIHDLSFIKFPDCHPQERVDWLTRNIGKSIEKSAHIITDSVYVRDEVIELLGANPDKVSSVPLGVANRFRPYSEDIRKPVLHRYRLEDCNYLLCVSTLEPRKNLLRLLSAYESLPESLKQRHALVLVGTQGWLVDDLANRISRLQETDNVRWLDYVPSEDLPAIYSGARAFIFPSLYEGFGLPILEAMACGTPVLCSSHPSVREVGGNAVYLMDELDDVSIRSGMERLLQDETLCAQLVQSGLERAGAFTWERCIDRTVNIYQSLSDRH